MKDVIPTLSFQPTISIAHAGRLLRRVEAHHHEQGWHDHANLYVYVVCDRSDIVTVGKVADALVLNGPPVSQSRYAAYPLLTGQLFQAATIGGTPPAKALTTFALNAAVASLESPQIASAGLGDTLKTMRAVLREPGVLGFIACGEIRHRDGREGRSALLVDVHDRIHEVLRMRGDTPALQFNQTNRTHMANALRILTDMSQNRTPAGQDAFMERYQCAECGG